MSFPNAYSFSAHVSAYKVVIEKWSKSDFTQHTSVIDYPREEMAEHLEKSFQRLKSEQQLTLTGVCSRR